MPQIIYSHLKEYAKSGQYPFHMPGHKTNMPGALKDVSKFDITEISGFDNLHQPEGIILEAQKRCAAVFGALESFFLVNGSTSGVEAAVLSVCNPNEKVIVARNCHKSVYSALVFSGARPVYVLPETCAQLGISGGVLPQTIEEAIKNHPTAKTVILTSPTYQGFTSDISEICKLAHDNAMTVIVDEAHGAHFAFSDFFPKSAILSGADIVVQSLHKTLPSLTQTAVLHICSKRVDRSRLVQSLSMVQTSSPSYLFLASIDGCIDFIAQNADTLFAQYINRLVNFRNSMKNLKNIRLLDEQMSGKFGIKAVDLGKLCFVLPNGDEAMDILRNKFNIELEMASYNHILAMTSPMDTDDGFFRLSKAMADIDLLYSDINITNHQNFNINLPYMEITPREAFFLPKTTIDFNSAKGEISGEFIIPYPPGIPIVVPGEVINQQTIDYIKYLKKHVSIIGLSDTTLCNISVIKKQ